MDKKSKLYVLDPEGILFKQFSKIDIEKLNITFARKLDTLLKRANMTPRDALLVDSENTEQWENGKSLSDQLPAGMKLFATSVGGGQVFRVGNPIDISLLYKKIDEDNSFVGQFLDEIPDRVKRQQSIDSILNIKDKNRYKNMDNIIATINKQEVDEVIMKEWNDPHKDLEIELDGIMDSGDDDSTLDVDDDGSKIIELSDIDISDADSDWTPPFELEIEGEVLDESFNNDESVVVDDTVDAGDEIIIEEFDYEDIMENNHNDIDGLDGLNSIESGLNIEQNHILNNNDNIKDVDNDYKSNIKQNNIPIPHKVIVKKNPRLNVGEKIVIEKGVDGWYNDNNKVDPINEVVEVGPDIIKDIPFKIEERRVDYLPKDIKEVAIKGVMGIEADGIIIKEPVNEIVLVGVGLSDQVSDIKKPNNIEEPTKKKRRRRRRRNKKNSDLSSTDIHSNNKSSEKSDYKDEDNTNINKILNELEIYDNYTSDVKSEESKDNAHNAEVNKREEDLNKSSQEKNNKTEEMSILDSLLDDIGIDEEFEDLPKEEPTPSIDSILNRLQGGL